MFRTVVTALMIAAFAWDVAGPATLNVASADTGNRRWRRKAGDRGGRRVLAAATANKWTASGTRLDLAESLDLTAGAGPCSASPGR